jgi:hypothetical protein
MADNCLPPLSERAAKLVDFLQRHVIAPLKVLTGLFDELSPEALRKFLERLAADGWIVKHDLPSHRGSYWSLSTQACNRLNLKRTGRPLRQAPLIRQCLVVEFFSQNKSLRLLTASECKSMLPAVFLRGSSNRYFLDSSKPEQLRLGWLLIDEGKAPLRVWTKARQVAVKKKAIPALRELCLSSQFYLSVATTTAAKAAKLDKLFHERPLTHIPVRVVAVGGDDGGGIPSS